MKIALVGPITGVLDRNRELFEVHADYLEGQGHVVASPTHLNCFMKPNVPWEECLAESIPHICHAEWIVVLPGCHTSRGSILEIAVALLLKKPIYRLVNGRLVRVDPELGRVLCRLLDVFARDTIDDLLGYEVKRQGRLREVIDG